MGPHRSDLPNTSSSRDIIQTIFSYLICVRSLMLERIYGVWLLPRPVTVVPAPHTNRRRRITMQSCTRILLLAWLSFQVLACQEGPVVESSVQHLNPDALHRNPAFSQAVVSEGPTRMVIVGGQNAMDASGEIVGPGDLTIQTEQAFRNLEVALAAGGASLEHVVKWNVYLVDGQPLEAGFAVFQSVWGDRPNPPAITTLFVAGLANPDFLVEIDAIAIVPMQ
jgi:enamine deaminase RidA (YjgF/YER057c/UK114 family)